MIFIFKNHLINTYWVPSMCQTLYKEQSETTFRKTHDSCHDENTYLGVMTQISVNIYSTFISTSHLHDNIWDNILKREGTEVHYYPGEGYRKEKERTVPLCWGGNRLRFEGAVSGEAEIATQNEWGGRSERAQVTGGSFVLI